MEARPPRDDVPAGRSARVDVLLAGSVTATAGRVVSTCSLVRDDGRVIVVDPGMVVRQRDILDPLERLGVRPVEVTDVVLSHHHPDHTLNAGLFPDAAVHDHWAIYRSGVWEDSEAEGRELTASVRLIRVPGHSAEDIALVAGTPEGIVVFSHLWTTETTPVDDPLCADLAILRRSRARVLAIADVVVPGHAAAFRPGPSTPR